MKIHEITLVTGHINKRFNISDFDIANGMRIGYSEGGTLIIKIHALIDNNIIMYALYDKSQTQLLSCVIGQYRDINNIKYFSIGDVYTPTEVRKQGYASALYKSLVKKYNIKLLSDIEHTESGRQIWNSIGRVLTISVLDTNTGKMFTREQIPDNIVYSRVLNSYVLIAEHKITGTIDMMGMRSNFDGILEDYRIYTHSENLGLYN
jgi:predicted GNAT family acetyltransferase